MIVGTIAGVLACVGFFNLQGYGRYSADIWNSGLRSAPPQSVQANATPPAQTQPDGADQAVTQGSVPNEQGYAPADQQQGYEAPQKDYGPPDQGQGYGPSQQGGAPPQPADGAVNQPPPQEPYR